MSAYADWTTCLPDEMTSIITALPPPPDWELGILPVIIIGFAWAGPDQTAGQACLDTLTSAAPPDLADIAATAWPQWQSAVDEVFPKGVRAYWKNTGLHQLDGAAIETLIKFAAEQSWVGTAFDLHHMGGAFGRASEVSTAFPDRGSAYWINIYGFWSSPKDDRHHIEYIRRLHRAMEPFSSGTQYLNFMAEEPDEPSRGGTAPDSTEVYGHTTLDRLRTLKRTWDPENIFQLNHNITPATENL